MKVLAIGGGSGGHVTPVAAVLRELAASSKDPLDVLFVCDRAFEKQARGIMAELPFAVKVRTIPSGKLRRYAHFSWWHYVRHFTIVIANIVDIFKIIAGFIASLWVIARSRPDVVFAKGGYVCLPMGLAAKLFRIPLVIHDSDVRPGLTNRVLSRYADAIGTGMPLENYTYRQSILHYVGVPISADIKAVTPEMQRQYRKDMGLPVDKAVVVAVGGGLGSVIINEAMVATARTLASRDDILFYNITGANNIESVKEQSRGLYGYVAEPFIYKDMHKVLGAADIVVTRASATTLQELAGLKKAVIAVPARQLGDQQQNATLFAKYDAVITLQDDDLRRELADVIVGLLANTQQQKHLAANLHQFAKPDAARDMARLIMAAIQDKGHTR